MGTNISNGLKLETTEGRDAFYWARELRAVMKDALLKQSLLENATQLRDVLTRPAAKAPKFDTYLNMRTQLVCDKGECLDLQVVLFEPEHCEYLLALPIGDVDPTERTRVGALAIDGVHEWPYWSGIRPEEVPAAEWERRKSDWDTIGYGPVIQYGIGIQLPEAERTPRVLADSYTEKEWRAVARTAFDNPRGLAERAVMNELWKELHTSRGNEFAEAVEGNMFGMLMDARDEASHLLDTRPGIVDLPDYDPELIMSSEPISGVRTRITPEEHTRAQDALLGS